MLGTKSISAVALSAILVAIGAWSGVLSPSHLAHVSASACFVIGLLASLALGLVSSGWKFDIRSRTALTIEDKEPVLVATDAPRELPGTVQRILLLAGFTSVGLVALSNHAVAKLLRLPTEWSEPSPSRFCVPKHHEEAAAEPEPPPPPVEQPGCALVKRAFELGYSKTLGRCAPKTATVEKPKEEAKVEVCTRRQLDEPYLHYGYRRVAEAAGATASVDPLEAVQHRSEEVRTHIDHIEDLLANLKHAITGSPHGAHHIWVNLPDPHDSHFYEHFTGEPRCSQRYANLPLWPQLTDRSLAFEHVLGHLLFATRFGSTASCNDFTIHWGAAADTCDKLAAHASDVFDGKTQKSVHAVLDRRKRLLQIGELYKALGRRPPPPPPLAEQIVSLSCFIVDRDAPATGKMIDVEGDKLALREVHVAALEPAGSKRIDLYVALAAMLAGPDTTIAAKPAELVQADVVGEDFPLTRLDPLVNADPFRGVRWPLDHAELLDVYPFEHHLHAFIDTFRRRYLSQRGRL